MFVRYLWLDPRWFFTSVLLVVFSVCCHEYMHAFTALKMGDDTAARNGHLTLNPFKQMGIFSLLLLLFVGIAWGQVPVNPANFRSRRGRILTSLAGPMTNLALWLIFIVAAFACHRLSDNLFARDMLIYGAILNFVLFVFNMLPVPGLDGFNVLFELFPRWLRSGSEVVNGAYFMLAVLLFAFVDKLFELAKIVTALTLIGLEKVCQ